MCVSLGLWEMGEGGCWVSHTFLGPTAESLAQETSSRGQKLLGQGLGGISKGHKRDAIKLVGWGLSGPMKPLQRKVQQRPCSGSTPQSPAVLGGAQSSQPAPRSTPSAILPSNISFHKSEPNHPSPAITPDCTGQGTKLQETQRGRIGSPFSSW